MDVASYRYRQAVAKAFRRLTGRAWSAPKTAQKVPGFYVLSAYDLDPLSWPSDLLAGVELVTPPLPMAEAEEVREELIEALLDLGGD